MAIAQDAPNVYAPSAPRGALGPLMRAVFVQCVRRNEFFVVVLLLALYAVGALVLRVVGIETPQTARFIRGFGLQLGSLMASLMVIVMGARQLAQELELRTIYPVLAKPVRRAEMIAGKLVPVWALGTAALLAFTLATLLITPTLAYQDAAVLMQALVLKSAALAMLAALTILLSLLAPAAIAMLIALALCMAGHMAANFIVQWSGGADAVRLCMGLMPDFAVLDQFQRYVDGGAALGGPMFAGTLLYGVLWAVVLTGLAILRFRRMAL